MTKEGFEAYSTYLALQRHFSTTYDYFKYNGKVKASIDSYKKRNDFTSFEKVAKIIRREDWVDFYVCHFLENPREWIRNMEKKNLITYQDRCKRILSTFETDLQTIKLNGVPETFRIGTGIPQIHSMCMSGDVSLETLAIIDEHIHPFLEKHKEEVKVPVIFPDFITKVIKYKPFVINKIADTYNSYIDVARKTIL